MNGAVAKAALCAAGAAVVALVATAPSGPAARAAPRMSSAVTAGPGCHPAQPAIAFHAGTGTSPPAALSPQPSSAPVPCGTDTGYASGESAIAVTNDNDVFLFPAVMDTTPTNVQAQYFLGGNAAFATTRDEGKTWQLAAPLSANISGAPKYPALDQIDDKFYMDRSTGRLFWTDPDLPSEMVAWTGDDGQHWGISVLPAGFGGEWTQVTTAKPVTSATSGYPKVVYACGEYDSVGRDVSQALEGDLCQKSLDGGRTWATAGQGFFGSPVDTHLQCGGASEHPDFSPYAAPAPDGDLYELLFCGGKTFLIRSADEGKTWPVHAQVPFAIPAPGPGGTGVAELRSDSAGNLYLAWVTSGNPNPGNGPSNGAIDLAVSRDGGARWGTAMNITPPGVTSVWTHFGFDVGAPGQVAMSCLCQAAGRPGYDGYIVDTADALDPAPLLWAGVTNDLSQAPLDFGGKGGSNGLGLDYVSAAIGPDGTPWASFWDACGEDLPSAAPSSCPGDRMPPGTTTYGYQGFAGHLAPG